MNSGTLFASGFAAQLRAMAALSVVQNDESLKSEINELENFVSAYGTLIAELQGGFASFSTGKPTWEPLTFPMLDAGGHDIIKMADKLAARLRTINVPTRPVRVPSWNTVKGNVAGTALDVASTAASTAKQTASTVLVVAGKSLLGNNPLKTLRDRIGQARITSVLERVKNPLSALQDAANAMLPRLKRGLDLGVELGTEVATVLNEMVSEVDFVNAETAAHLHLEAQVGELTVLRAFADEIEKSARQVSEIGKAAVIGEAVKAMEFALSGDKLNVGAREQLRQAVAELAATDNALSRIAGKMSELFAKFAAVGDHFRIEDETVEPAESEPTIISPSTQVPGPAPLPVRQPTPEGTGGKPTTPASSSQDDPGPPNPSRAPRKPRAPKDPNAPPRKRRTKDKPPAE